MKIVIRADASHTMGGGHLMRCLTLAEALRKRGAVVSFIARERDGALGEMIEQRGFAVSRLAGPHSNGAANEAAGHASWLGVPSEEDARDTRATIDRDGTKPDWLVIDHYAIDQSWEAALRPIVGRIMVIDDLADRAHDCDLLLDQNLVADMHSRYDGKVPSDCSTLFGPRYALLQPVFAELHDRIPPRAGAVKRILIYFGGADRGNLTGRALAGFLQLNRTDIAVDVVVSASSPHQEALTEEISRHGNIQLHGDLPSLAPLIARADLAIGATGSTSWERLCLGLPTIAVTLAANQRPIADELARRDLVELLGHEDEVGEADLRQAIERVTRDGLHEDCSTRCSAEVDGKGTSRVCAIMTVSRDSRLQARSATVLDEPQLLGWSGDGAVGAKDGSEARVLSDQRTSLRRGMRDLGACRYYVVETEDGVDLGHVRFEREDRRWTTCQSVARGFRAHDVDQALLRAALRTFRAELRGPIILAPVTEAEPGVPSRRISLCSDEGSWINEPLPRMITRWLLAGHQVTWTHDAVEIPEGDICFFLSYGRIVGDEILSRHKNNLVVHESALPQGRGWSPLTWQVLEGATSITVTLFEATQTLDGGPIYLQGQIALRGDELVDDLRELQANVTIQLCDQFLTSYPDVLKQSKPQAGEPSYYRRRDPSDSQIDPDQALRTQFNLLRVCDNERYPCWFEIDGVKYDLKILRS